MSGEGLGEGYENYYFSHSLEGARGLVVQPACADSKGKDTARGSQTLLQSPCSNSGIFSLHKYIMHKSLSFCSMAFLLRSYFGWKDLSHHAKVTLGTE